MRVGVDDGVVLSVGLVIDARVDYDKDGGFEDDNEIGDGVIGS